MLYLADEGQSFGFLYSVVYFLLPLSPKERDSSTSPVMPPMDPDPPDHSTTPTPPPPPHSTMPTPLVPPRNPSPPRQTKDLNQTPIQPHMELVSSLEALQLSSRAAPSSTHQDEEQVATPYNLLLKVADTQGTQGKSQSTQSGLNSKQPRAIATKQSARY